MDAIPLNNENNLPQANGKVLVVDDDDSVRSVVKTYLEYQKLTVKAASDGIEALERLKEESFDVVITDILMPKMDGLTLAGEIRHIQHDVEIIIMTGYASVNSAVESIKIDVFDYIIKPFQNMQSLYNTVQRAIEHKRLIHERKALVDNLTRANNELRAHRNLLSDKIKEIDSELTRRVERLTTLYEISRSISSITSLNELLGKIMVKIVSAMNNSGGILWLLDRNNKTLRKIHTVNLESSNIIPDVLNNDEIEVNWAFSSGRTRVFTDIEDLSNPLFKKVCIINNVSSVIIVPLKFENKILGSINILFKGDVKINDDDVSLLESIADQASVSIRNADLYEQQQILFRETIEALATAIDSRDHYTGGHSYMVTNYALAIAKKMGFGESRMELMRIAGMLHDVGKIGISDSILNKPGKLTDEEMGVIKAHPILGLIILESIQSLKPVAKIVYHHHERYDGKGYPEGVSGENIPLESRILQVVDIFHALTSDRIYRPAMSLDKAVSIIREGLGTVSDPVIGKLFLELIEGGELDDYISKKI